MEITDIFDSLGIDEDRIKYTKDTFEKMEKIYRNGNIYQVFPNENSNADPAQ